MSMQNIDKNIDTLHKNLKAMTYLLGNEPADVARASIPGYIESSHALLEEMRLLCAAKRRLNEKSG